MQIVDNILNNFTMYKLVLYLLLIISSVSLIFSLVGLIPYEFIDLFVSFIYIQFLCFSLNIVLSKLFKIPINPESAIITAIIIFLILTPINSINSFIFYSVCGIAAIFSKYFIVLNKKHLFNPAALGLFLIGVLGSGQSLWWSSNQFMFPLVLIAGLLIVRKVRKFSMFITFLSVSILTTLLFITLNKADPFTSLPLIFTSYPILFLGTVMLTEPITMPPSKNFQMIYAVIVGFFSGAQFHLGPIFATPELALLIGNIFSYFVSFKERLTLILKEKKQLSSDIYEFVFSSNKNFTYLPGQYMDWTLGGFRPDTRGARRVFSLASSPSEEDVKIGIRIKNDASMFKKRLLELDRGDRIFAGNLAGDFILPNDKNEKLVFIAGGIGITPFRSIIKNSIDKKEKRDIVLFYLSSNEKDFIYKDVFNSANVIGLKTVYIHSKPSVSGKGLSGRIDQDTLIKEVPDYKNRIYYISGPNIFVENYKKLLKTIGIKRSKIMVDYFSGY